MSRENNAVRRTVVLRVDREEPDVEKIRLAADVIRNGGTVAFPTETVYGLGADALNQEAVMKIFKAKMRPPDNPIIVHVSSKDEVYTLTEKVPESALRIMEAFWPGPLTLILKASTKVPRITTAGLDTVAIRMPSHKVALALIKESGTPIAAPSANLSGKPSPTTPEHVLRDLDGRIDLILDAGPTDVGVESTVLDLTVDPPQVLRPGGTPYEDLVEVLGEVRLHPLVTAEREMGVEKPRSPGMKHKHYAPAAEVVLVEGLSLDGIVRKVREIASMHASSGKRVGILATDESIPLYDVETYIVKSLGSRSDPSSLAKNLFRTLRELDDAGVDVIVAEGVGMKGLGLAVMNRLRKASGYNIVKA